MIQRVQTIWMILAALITFLTIKFSFYSGTLAADNAYHVLMATDNFLILILTSALGTGVIINIFLFKHRSVQFRIILFALLAECILIFLYIRETNKYSAGSFSLWSALHLLIIVFLILAARGIYKDSKMIKESNRLR
ncbi:MAG: DUF4293 family protein [Ginsengibacter sp.]